MLSLAQVRSADLGQPGRDKDVRTKAGLPAPLVDIRLLDARGAEAPLDGKARGEIVVRAPWLTQAYVGNTDASEQLWAGGYLHSGDIGVIEADGYLRVVDRIKDVIKTGGEWVSSAEIEDLIAQCEGVAEAAVIGIDDEKWGERPIAFVIKNKPKDTAVSEAAIKAHLKTFADAGRISKFGIPDRILFAETLARTSVGKVDKKRLKAGYADR